MQTLSSRYVPWIGRPLDTSTASDSTTKGYLEELQAIASQCGRSFESVLQKELMKISTGRGVNLPTNSHDATAQEVEDVKAPSQVVQQPSLLLGSPSPEIVRSLPAVFPPSPLPRRGQSGLRSDTQAASTPALRRLEVPTRGPQVTSLSTSLDDQLQPAATLAPILGMATNLNISNQGSLSDMISGNGDTAATTYSVLTIIDVNSPTVQRVVVEQLCKLMKLCLTCTLHFASEPSLGRFPAQIVNLIMIFGEQMLTYS